MFLKYMLILVFPRQHHGNHTVGYCASYFVFFMNKYVNINISNNSGLRNDSIKNITFSVTAGRQLSCGLPWIPQNFFCNREKSVCVCIVLVHYGPFPQEINGKSVNLAVWAVSVIFLFDFTLFVIDIHHIMLISLFPTPFDHFHFHPTLGLDPALILTLRPKTVAIEKVIWEGGGILREEFGEIAKFMVHRGLTHHSF